MDKVPKLSIVIPIYVMHGEGELLLRRCLDSLLHQTFKDFEVVISDDSENDLFKILMHRYEGLLNIRYIKNVNVHGMAGNTNNAINEAHGELIKILFQDDYLYSEQSLQNIVDAFTDSDNWLVTGCSHTDGRLHLPVYNEEANTIGSPSVLTIRNGCPVRFDKQFYWVLDLDFYRQCFRLYGEPHCLNETNVVIGIGPHQATHHLGEVRKNLEFKWLKEKYDTSSPANV